SELADLLAALSVGGNVGFSLAFLLALVDVEYGVVDELAGDRADDHRFLAAVARRPHPALGRRRGGECRLGHSTTPPGLDVRLGLGSSLAGGGRCATGKDLAERGLRTRHAAVHACRRRLGWLLRQLGGTEARALRLAFGARLLDRPSRKIGARRP